MPHRDQEIAMLRRELEMLMTERQTLLRVVGSGAALIASLSPRELDILRGIARGASNKEIAREHGIAETTVKIHVQHVLRKLNVSSRVHAAVIASENGLL